MPPKNAKRNEKDRKRRADGLLRHQQDLAEKQAEIDHLHGSLTGALGQLENFEGASRGDHPRLPEVYAALPGVTTDRLAWSIAGVAVGGGSEMGWRLRG
jgi:hypothetical protein